MPISRALIATALIALTAIAFAENEVQDVRNALANTIDAIVTDCPAMSQHVQHNTLSDPPACMRAMSSFNVTRLDVEYFVLLHNGVVWRLPWTEQGDAISRVMTTTGTGQHWLVVIVPVARIEQLIIVLEFVPQ